MAIFRSVAALAFTSVLVWHASKWVDNTVFAKLHDMISSVTTLLEGSQLNDVRDQVLCSAR